jgi:hypothetical protein
LRIKRSRCLASIFTLFAGTAKFHYGNDAAQKAILRPGFLLQADELAMLSDSLLVLAKQDLRIIAFVPASQYRYLSATKTSLKESVPHNSIESLSEKNPNTTLISGITLVLDLTGKVTSSGRAFRAHRWSPLPPRSKPRGQRSSRAQVRGHTKNGVRWAGMALQNSTRFAHSLPPLASDRPLLGRD